MALATTCPQCKTSFKVVPDQLKLRRGLVRCGVCQHVFSGIDYLRYVDDAARAAQRLARERAASSEGIATDPPPMAGPSVALGDTVPPSVFGVPPVPPPPEFGGSVFTSLPGGHASTGSVPPRDVVAMLAASAQGAESRSTSPLPPQRPTPPSAPRLADPAPSPSPIAHDDASPSAVTGTPAAATGLPPDPWAAAARAAHERSIRDEPPAYLPPAGLVTTTPAGSDRPALARHASDPPTRPVLPAPSSRSVPTFPIEDLGGRPTEPWPQHSGPQTVIDPDDDLKTAFFIPDSGFGPTILDGTEPAPDTRIDLPAEPLDRGTASDAPGGGGLPGLALRPESPSPRIALTPEATSPESTVTERSDLFDTPVAIEPTPRVNPRSSEPAAIDYFSGRRTHSRSLGLALSPVAWAAAAALMLLLVLQATLGWRDAIAARAPTFAPVLAAIASPLGLRIEPPRDLDALTIESFELQAAGMPNTLQLGAVLRNRGGHVVAYPAMELMLTDTAGALLVRKVIRPEAYVGDASTVGEGLPARSERPLKLLLEHNGLQATGYSVALFYP